MVNKDVYIYPISSLIRYFRKSVRSLTVNLYTSHNIVIITFSLNLTKLEDVKDNLAKTWTVLNLIIS